MRRLQLAAALALIAAGAALEIDTIARKSATFDEPINLVHGLASWRRGDWTAPVDYAPLSRWLAAAAVELSGAPARLAPEEVPWTPGILPRLAQEILYLRNDADALLYRARLAFVPLHLFVAAGVGLWSLRLWGPWGALLSLALAVLAPPLLANGPLVTSDMLVTTALFLGALVLARWRRTGRLVWALGAGALFGLALLAKHSGLIGLPVAVVVGLTARALPWRRRLAGVAVVCALAAGVVWTFYGFRFDAVRAGEPEAAAKAALLEDFRARHVPSSSLEAAVVELGERLHVLPEPYLLTLRFTLKTMEHRLSYFMGERSIDDSPWYFPVAVALKTPLGCLLLVGLAIAALVARRTALASGEALALGLLPAVYFAIACASASNLGLRYVLPVYPFLFVLAGGAASWWRSGRAARVLVAGALAWSAASALAYHPHHLAYFNELAGGPRGGIRYLGDSNLDWGQDLRSLGPWMERHGVERVALGYFGTALPEFYGFAFDWLPSVGFRNDRPGGYVPRPGDVVAVSATCLQGFYFPDPDTYRWLDAHEPIDHLGYSIYLYRIAR